MQKQLPDFSQASILVVGDLMLDRYWFGDTARISPEAPVPIVRIKQTDDRPGGAGNVALNIAALNAKVTLLGIAGNDAAANTLMKQLSAAQVQHHIIQHAELPTITKLRIISRHQQLLRLDFEDAFSTQYSDALIALFKEHLPYANLVILSDYNKGALNCAPQLIQLAKAANIPILVDPKGNNFTIYNGATLITPNLKEFETIVGVCHSEKELIQKGHHFLEHHAIDTLLLTRGEHGMTLIQKNNKEIHLPAHAREVFDVTGAGDTVIATLGTAMASGASLPNAMALANLAASLVVTKLGAAAISAQELQIAHTHSSTSNKILSKNQLLSAINEARSKGKKIIFTNGCFDLLHAGHVTYLQQAKQLGDYLIVAINDDDSVTRLKGAGRPINPVTQRLAVLAGLDAIDWVISFTDNTPEQLLNELKPDVLVKGGDYTIDHVVGAGIVQAYGGEVRVLSMVNDISTTLIIERMIQSHQTTLA